MNNPLMRMRRSCVASSDKLQFAAKHCRRVREVASSRGGELLEASHRLYAALYQEHPFLEPPSELVRKVLASVSLDSPE
jgi:hypothetical protein